MSRNGDIFTFPTKTGGQACLRLMLAVADLGLRPSDDMGFVGRCVLVQVSRHAEPKDDSFEPGRLALNGLFLAYRPRIWKQLGFVHAGRRPATPEEVEFPSWFGHRGVELYFCRGQQRIKLSRKVVGSSVRRWDVGLSPTSPHGLTHHTDLSAAGVRQRYGGTDARYSKHRREIEKAVGLSLDQPYWEAIAEVRGARKRLETAVRAR